MVQRNQREELRDRIPPELKLKYEYSESLISSFRTLAQNGPAAEDVKGDFVVLDDAYWAFRQAVGPEKTRESRDDVLRERATQAEQAWGKLVARTAKALKEGIKPTGLSGLIGWAVDHATRDLKPSQLAFIQSRVSRLIPEAIALNGGVNVQAALPIVTAAISKETIDKVKAVTK